MEIGKEIEESSNLDLLNELELLKEIFVKELLLIDRQVQRLGEKKKKIDWGDQTHLLILPLKMMKWVWEYGH